MNDEEMMETEVETEEVETEKSGISTGKVLLIGAGLAVATAAAVKFGKSVYAKLKAKKDSRKADEEDFADVNEEEDVDVAE